MTFLNKLINIFKNNELASSEVSEIRLLTHEEKVDWKKFIYNDNFSINLPIDIESNFDPRISLLDFSKIIKFNNKKINIFLNSLPSSTDESNLSLLLRNVIKNYFVTKKNIKFITINNDKLWWHRATFSYEYDASLVVKDIGKNKGLSNQGIDLLMNELNLDKDPIRTEYKVIDFIGFKDNYIRPFYSIAYSYELNQNENDNPQIEKVINEISNSSQYIEKTNID
jgi:hypothetical protein